MELGFRSSALEFSRVMGKNILSRTLRTLGLMVAASFVELLGLGIVIPVAAILLDEQAVLKSGLVRDLWLTFGSPNRTNFVMLALLVLIIVYVFRAAFLALVSWLQAGYIQKVKQEVSSRLFRKYLNLSLEERRQKSAADLIRVMGVEINIFIDYVLGPSLVLLAELFVMAAVVSLLLVLQPIAAITISLVFLVSMGTFSLATRKRVKAWSSQRQESDQIRMKVAKEGLESIAEVRSFGRLDVFADDFDEKTRISLASSQKYIAVSQLPRLWMETSAVVALASALVVFVIQGLPMNEIMTSLGIFAVAAFRLLPTANRLVTSVQSIKFGSSSFRFIIEELITTSGTKYRRFYPSQSLENFQTLSISDLEYRHPGNRNVGVSVNNFQIRVGERIGIFGESGSGKTTFIDCLTGLLTPWSGSFVLDDKPVNFGSRKQNLLFAYVSQNPYMLDRSLEENITFGQPWNEVDQAKLQAVIEIAQISSLSQTFFGQIGDSGTKLSGGQRQRIAIARALYKDAPILVLDEGTSALDKRTEEEFFNATELLPKSKSIILVSHNRELLGSCDRIYEMRNGILVESTGASL